MDKGITYVASGLRFKEEAAISASSLKVAMPTIHTTIFCDNKDGVNSGLFDGIVILPKPRFSFFDKIYSFLHSPYQKTIFIDTDTYIVNPFWELFDILDRFDVAGVRDHWSGEKADFPRCFDDLNTGLICYRMSPKVKKVFADWHDIYDYQLKNNIPVDHDQPSFSSAIYKNSEVSLYVLPKTYNIRLTSPIFLGINFVPVILHGRSNDFKSIVKKLETTSDFRFLLPNGSLIDRTYQDVIDRKSGVIFFVAIRLAIFLTRMARFIKRLIFTGSKRSPAHYK